MNKTVTHSVRRIFCNRVPFRNIKRISEVVINYFLCVQADRKKYKNKEYSG